MLAWKWHVLPLHLNSKCCLQCIWTKIHQEQFFKHILCSGIPTETDVYKSQLLVKKTKSKCLLKIPLMYSYLGFKRDTNKAPWCIFTVISGASAAVHLNYSGHHDHRGTVPLQFLSGQGHLGSQKRVNASHHIVAITRCRAHNIRNRKMSKSISLKNTWEHDTKTNGAPFRRFVPLFIALHEWHFCWVACVRFLSVFFFFLNVPELKKKSIFPPQRKVAGGGRASFPKAASWPAQSSASPWTAPVASVCSLSGNLFRPGSWPRTSAGVKRLYVNSSSGVSMATHKSTTDLTKRLGDSTLRWNFRMNLKWTKDVYTPS